MGEAPSLGMRKGVVTDLEETVRSIEAATERAERMAGVHVSHVYVGVTGEHITSTNNHARRRGLRRRTAKSSPPTLSASSTRARSSTLRPTVRSSTRCRATSPSTVRTASTDPLGMSGGRLEVDTHIVTGGSTFITNVLKCVSRAGLETDRHRLRAAGLVGRDAARRREAHRRVSCSTSAAERPISPCTPAAALIHSATIPVGGNILTNDIALGLKTTFAEAENLKRTYGSGASHDDRARRRGVSGQNARRPQFARHQLGAAALDRACRASSNSFA